MTPLLLVAAFPTTYGDTELPATRVKFVHFKRDLFYPSHSASFLVFPLRPSILVLIKRSPTVVEPHPKILLVESGRVGPENLCVASFLAPNPPLLSLDIFTSYNLHKSNATTSSLTVHHSLRSTTQSGQLSSHSHLESENNHRDLLERTMASNKSVSLSPSIQASPSSPGSSGGLDSLDGSPETKVTVFSPEHVRTPNKSHRGEATTGNEPPAFTLQQTHYKLPSYMKSPKISESSPAKRSGQKAQKTTGVAYKDPFLTADTLKANTLGTHEQKLSPTASTFTPLTEKQGPWGTGFGRLSASSSASNTSGVGLPTPPPNVGKAESGDLGLHRFLQSLTLGPSQVTSVGQTADPLPKPEIPLLPTPPGSASSIGQELEVISALNIQNLSKQTGFQVVSGFFNVSRTIRRMPTEAD